ncbi:MAG: transcriptional repressor [Candidatus Competibacteraceae bacterium]|nr:MAG: transcriptional repressor [Candidatus Competibacteraceae bacterium]
MPSSKSDRPMPPDARQALEQAALLCQQRGARLTELRRRVLEIIWNSPAPLGAYAILDILRDEGRPGAPPTVYRALDFLLEQGLIHRLASLNVFTGCRQPGSHHGGQFLICQECGLVDELSNPRLEELLQNEAAIRQFEVLAQTVEMLGRCPACRNGVARHAG